MALGYSGVQVFGAQWKGLLCGAEGEYHLIIAFQTRWKRRIAGLKL